MQIGHVTNLIPYKDSKWRNQYHKSAWVEKIIFTHFFLLSQKMLNFRKIMNESYGEIGPSQV